MRKSLFPVVALLAFAACTKVTPVPVSDARQEISFEVANYLPTKANVKYDTSVPFGTYAWFNNGSGTAQDFMVNETVGFVGGVWKTTVNAFYWPKTGDIDFISYSPFAGTNGNRPAASAGAANGTASSPAAPEPVITRVKDKDYTFEYNNYQVALDSYDLLYADWANAKSNVNAVNDGVDSGYEGVPTLFHHALTKLGFEIRAFFVEYPAENPDTFWEMTLKSAKLEGIYDTGSLKLTMDDAQGWVKPDGGVWTPDETAPKREITLYEIPAGGTGMKITKEYQPLLADFYVLPQLLGTSTANAPAQKLHLAFHIKTTLSSGAVITEDYEKSFDISALTRTQSKAWQMNQYIRYKVSIKPTSGDPNDPTPEDVLITFDPAVEGWDEVTTAAVISI